MWQEYIIIVPKNVNMHKVTEMRILGTVTGSQLPGEEQSS